MAVTGRVPMAEHLRAQGHGCAELGSPLYAALLEHCADDVLDGGPTAAVLAGHEHDPGPSALALRLLGSVHRLVLTGRLPALAAHYPSTGGDGDAAAAWPVLRAAFDRHAEQIRPLLHRTPQTNEVGRSAALLGGLLQVVAAFDQPVALHEIGSSAGLNLVPDRHAYLDADDRVLWGDPQARVRLADAWRGALPPLDRQVEVVERHGSDTAPLDAADTEDALSLQAYVWPDMTGRLERLRAAMEVARAAGVQVRRLDALEGARRATPRDGVVTVLWHSVMRQYLPAQARELLEQHVEQAGAAASSRAPFAHLALEPARRAPGGRHEFLLVLRTWPGGARVLASARGHGPPVHWE